MKNIRRLPRRVWNWIVWDRRNAFITAGVLYGLLVAFVAVNMIAPYFTSEPAQADPAPSATAAPTPGITGTATPKPSASWLPTLSPTPTATPTAGTTRADRERAATDAATGFVTTWLDARALPADAWTRKISALTKGQATQLVQATTPAMVPYALVVKGEPVKVEAFTAVVNVTITNGEVVVVTLDPNDKWLVTEYGPEHSE